MRLANLDYIESVLRRGSWTRTENNKKKTKTKKNKNKQTKNNSGRRKICCTTRTHYLILSQSVFTYSLMLRS